MSGETAQIRCCDLEYRLEQGPLHSCQSESWPRLWRSQSYYWAPYLDRGFTTGLSTSAPAQLMIMEWLNSRRHPLSLKALTSYRACVPSTVKNLQGSLLPHCNTSGNAFRCLIEKPPRERRFMIGLPGWW